MRETRARASGSLASAANVLKVLRLLEDQQTLTVSELGRVLDVGKSTAHRLLGTLVAEGFVTRDAVRRRYYAGRALMDIGLAAVGPLDVRQRAQLPLARLAAETGATAKLLVLQGQYARCVHIAEAPRLNGFAGSVGQSLPANSTAGGKLLLCGIGEEAVRRRFPRGLPSVTKHTITDWDTFLVELRTVRERGWATNFEGSEIGLHGIAVGIPGMAQCTQAALAVSAPVARLPKTHSDQLVVLRHMRTAFDVMLKDGFPAEGDMSAGTTVAARAWPPEAPTSPDPARVPVD